jgi:hypothetical protein
MDCDKYYDMVTSDQVIGTLAFFYGASQHVGINERTVKAPGSSIVNGLFQGLLYAGGFGFLASMCPRPYKVVLTTALVASIGFYQYKQLDQTSTDLDSVQV